MYKINTEKLDELFQLINEEMDLILPIKKAGQVNFDLFTKGSDVDLKVLNTAKSPKDAFFPQGENLYTVRYEDKKMKVEPESLRDKEFVLFGVRPCDVKGIEVLDKVFLSEPIDSYYAARREAGIIVSLGCSRPEETCFCSAFGIDATKALADVNTWIVDEYLYWEASGEKGEKLTQRLKSLLTDSDDSKVEGSREQTKAIIEKLPFADLSLEGWGGDSLDEKFNSDIWEGLYKSCLACGTCTFVCPTCQCYDIKDYNAGESVSRYRCWDSCMYSDFTMMAHGNNRTTQMQRFRQRFMHKLVYFPDNNDGMYSCVGCGRCVSKCPSSLNIVKVIKAFEKGGEA
ncbi:MAG: 4Fe-4S dicluster domain-containing protein [Suipraeoptans sp.]